MISLVNSKLLGAPVASPPLSRCGARFLSTPSGTSPGPAFCFDIDGVLKQGQKVLPEAKEVLQILTGKNKRSQKFPFILITNGGGSLESVRAKRLSGELGIPIAENQIVQSHTIFKALAGTYANSPVLIVGGQKDSCRQVAEAYGFKHAYIPADVLAWNPAVWPFDKLTDEERGYIKKADFSNIRFAAVLVFHDSRDWGRDIQLSIDLMRAEKGVFGTCKDPSNAALWTAEKQLPLYFSNPDLLWGNDFSQPRFGQGALQESMAAVYKATTGHELKRSTGGKPSRVTYEYSAKLLYDDIAAMTGSSAPYKGNVYMIGDNPRSDIAGANAFGWESILVRTGVFRGKASGAEHTPTIVLPNVLDGVRWALKREGHEI